MGVAAARALPASYSPARRWHFRRRQEDGQGSAALPGLAILMSAQYHAPTVEVVGLQVHAAFDIENANGYSVGFHIFDPETGTLVVDGARTPVEEDRAHLDMSFELPPEPGRYRVFVSPMRENVAWYYERGWRFLLIDAIVADGRATIERVRIATRKTIARERLGRTIG